MLTEVMSHIHPIVVHFPIVLIWIGICWDLVQVIKNRKLAVDKGIWIWVFAALGAALAVATGPDHDARGNTNLLHTHENFADATAWLVALLAACRLWMVWSRRGPIRSWLLTGYMILALVSGGLVLGAGYYGGMMVYDQGIGVKVNGKAVNPPIHRTNIHHNNG